MIELTINERALRRLAEVVSRSIGYRFDDADWDGVVYGYKAAGLENEGWFAYPLIGRVPVQLEIASSPAPDNVTIRIDADPETETMLQGILRVMEENVLEEIRRAFVRVPRPAHFTNYTHCSECREHDDLMRSRTPDTLTLEDVRFEWSPVPLLTAEGFRYYFPALVRLALSDGGEFRHLYT